MEAQKTPYHHGSLQRALIEASLELIQRHGVDGFSLAQAAKIAGVSVAAPYRHFENKRALLNAVASFGFQELGNRLDAAALLNADDPVEVLLDLGSEYVAFAIDRPALFTVMFSNRGRDPQSQSGLATLAVLGNTLEHLAADGRLAVPLDTALRSTWSLVHGLATLHVGGMRTIAEEDAPRLRREILRPLLSGGILLEASSGRQVRRSR
jgi:AcrR family transcriptional regulator